MYQHGNLLWVLLHATRGAYLNDSVRRRYSWRTLDMPPDGTTDQIQRVLSVQASVECRRSTSLGAVHGVRMLILMKLQRSSFNHLSTTAADFEVVSSMI